MRTAILLLSAALTCTAQNSGGGRQNYYTATINTGTGAFTCDFASSDYCFVTMTGTTQPTLVPTITNLPVNRWIHFILSIYQIGGVNWPTSSPHVWCGGGDQWKDCGSQNYWSYQSPLRSGLGSTQATGQHFSAWSTGDGHLWMDSSTGTFQSVVAAHINGKIWTVGDTDSIGTAGTFSLLFGSQLVLNQSSYMTFDTDVGIMRPAAGILEIDTGSGTAGTAANFRGLRLSYLESRGTTFTVSGCATTSSLTGGATAGKFTTSLSGTCTPVVTMGNSATAATGWTCWMNNLTHPGTTNIMQQTASTTTTATFTGTSIASDVMSFGCIAY